MIQDALLTHPNSFFRHCHPVRKLLRCKANKGSDGASCMTGWACRPQRLLCCTKQSTAGKGNSVHIYSEKSERSLDLTNTEVKLIQQSWRNIKNKGEAGKEVLRRLLLTNEAVRVIFDLHNCPPDQFDKNEVFVNHAKALELFLRICAASITVEPERLVSIARRVGERHVYFRRVTFDAAYWLRMKAVMVDVIALKQRPKEALHVAHAWNKLLSFVISEIKNSFMQELNRKNTMPQDKEFSLEDAKEKSMQQLKDDWQYLKRSIRTISNA
ncbi:hypothetical protein D918_08679 [Trichuris suis]|nr:hypothetical protein D918_08679 [Trichuris suis]